MCNSDNEKVPSLLIIMQFAQMKRFVTFSADILLIDESFETSCI